MISCNDKKASSKIRNENPKKEVIKKLTGKEVVNELDNLHFFNLTEEEDLSEVKVDLEKSYTDMKFFHGKLRGETLDFLDNRFYWVDCEELFELGGLTEYLGQVKRTFNKLGLELEFSNEKSEQNSEIGWTHSIELNGIEYLAFEGKFSNLDWGIAYANFLEMLNSELRRQGSNEQFYPISCGNDGTFVLLTVQQFDFVRRHYPNHDEHPTTIGSWKNTNGL